MCVGNDVEAWKSGCAGSMNRGSVSPHVTAHSSMRSCSTTKSISWNTLPSPLLAQPVDVYVRHVRASHLPARRAVTRSSIVSMSSVNSVAHNPTRLTMCESLPPMPR